METERIYKFGESRLVIRFGDITTSSAQVLVSSDDNYLTMGGGVSAALLDAGGQGIALDATKKVPAAVGDVVVTTAGSLQANYIFHAVTLDFTRESPPDPTVIEQVTRRSLQLLDALRLHSIAFPALGTGVAGIKHVDAAANMAEVITADFQTRENPIEVTIYLFQPSTPENLLNLAHFFEQFAARSPGIAAHVTNANVRPTEAAQTIDEAENEAGARTKRVYHVRKLLAVLDDQRNKLEEQLIECMGSGRDDAVDSARKKLRDNEEIRLSYLTELKGLTSTDTAPAAPEGVIPKPKSVFLSSTYKDLVTHRNAVRQKIEERSFSFVGMEEFGAASLPPAAKIIQEVRSADVYIGIFGVRYGSIDPVTGLSMTELELNEAEASGKQRLLYVMSDDAPVKVSDIEADPGSKAKLNQLKARILASHTVHLFNTADDLANRVYLDLGNLYSSEQDR